MAQRASDPLPEDPSNPLLNSTCFDLLLIELVPMTYRIAADLAAKEDAWLATKRPRSLQARANRQSLQSQSLSATGAVGTTSTAGASKSKKDAAKPPLSEEEKALAGLGIGQVGGTAPGADEEELREAVFYRLDGMGYRVGLGITEKYVCA
jgi:trafficking protein particle complex subunit 6